MHTDRTTKILLAAIALGLWANVFRPAFEPTPATAQEPVKPTPVNIVQFNSEKLTGGLPVEGAGQAALPITVQGSPAAAPVPVEGTTSKSLPVRVQVIR